MLLEPLSKDGKPQGKCFAKKCDQCVQYRNWEVIHNVTQEKSIQKLCCLEVLYNEIPKLVGSIDGCQQASNETRNIVIDFGSAAVNALSDSPKPLLPDKEAVLIEG